MLHRGRPVSPLVPLMALAMVAIMRRPSRDDLSAALVLLTLFVPWQAWVIRRAAHIMRVTAYVDAKRFEPEGRYMLSAEYHDTEHATLAARRRKLRLKRPR